ncbi:hypothetical protein BH10PLA2_BH10PLA2_12130 [soil metagenome]
MSDYLTDIDVLKWEAGGLEDGSSKIALLEEAVRLADSHNNIEAGFKTRMDLIEAAQFGGRPDLSIVSFSWCLSQHDQDPELEDAYSLLYRYKWIVSSLPEFPEISRQQIDAMLADLKRRYTALGGSLHSVVQLKTEVHRSMGDLTAAEESMAKLERLECDRFSDCRACTVDHATSYLVDAGRDEEAFEKAQPILNGRMRCAEIPWRTYSKLLLSALRLGCPERGMTLHQKSFRKISSNPKWIDRLADHLMFLALTHNAAKGAKLLERQLLESLNTPSQLNRLHFLRGVTLFLDHVLEQNKKSLKLRLPASFPIYVSEGIYDTTELKSWVDSLLENLADRFDARNGNNFYRKLVEGTPALKALAMPCPLSARG